MCASHSVVSDSVTPWTVAHQAPLSTGFSRQEYWNGLNALLQGNLPDPGIEPGSPALTGRFFTIWATGGAQPLGKYSDYSVVLITTILQSDSVLHTHTCVCVCVCIHTYTYILFKNILSHYGLSQDIEYSFLCYTVGPCCLSILHIIVCIY